MYERGEGEQGQERQKSSDDDFTVASRPSRAILQIGILSNKLYVILRE